MTHFSPVPRAAPTRRISSRSKPEWHLAGPLFRVGCLLILTQCAAPNPGVRRAAADYERNASTIHASPGPEQVSDRDS